MSKHARRHAMTRTLLLAALAVVVVALRREPRWVRRVRLRLDVQRPALVRPSYGRTLARHRADDRTAWRELTALAERRVSGRMLAPPVVVVRGRVEAMTFVLRVLDVVRDVRAANARAGWEPGWPVVRRAGWHPPVGLPWPSSVGNLTGVVGAVLSVLVVASVVGQVGTAPAPLTSIAAMGFRDNHVSFTRHLLEAPVASSETAPSPERSGSAADADRGTATAKRSSTPAPTSPAKDSAQVGRDRDPVRVAPYLYLNSNHLPDVGAVMRRTGVTEFTLAF
ncbi:MAG: hypothetical protein GEV04_21945, partial [Actinophytocola sp.]|nr:hypothetical protein [Actinophytocola sp.]